MFRFFLNRVPPSAIPKMAAVVYRAQIEASGLSKYFTPKAIAKSQASVTVFTNQHYINSERKVPSLERVLTHTTAVSVTGDKEGFFQDGTPFPASNDFFADLKPGDARGLSPEERLVAAKKIIVSNSLAFAYGGYPNTNSTTYYKEPLEVGIFSQAGAQFEMPYLHYSLFGLDAANTQITQPLFSHLYKDLPTSYDECKKALSASDYAPNFGRIHIGFPLLARHENGRFHLSMFKKNSIILLNKAYERHLLEDTALLLTAVNESAKIAGKPAFLKATAVGMGFFSMVDCCYDIKHHLYPFYLRAFRDLLQTGQYPNIAAIEFPIFSPLFEECYTNNLPESSYGGVDVGMSRRDVLAFNDIERDKYYVCIINPSDANALPGNEWANTSLESTIANNSSLRFDQVYLMNPMILKPTHHVSVAINTSDFTTEIQTQGPSRSLNI